MTKRLDAIAKSAFQAEAARQGGEDQLFVDWGQCWQVSAEAVKAEVEKWIWVKRFAFTGVVVAIAVAWKAWQ
jgi:hypothetical protein